MGRIKKVLDSDLSDDKSLAKLSCAMRATARSANACRSRRPASPRSRTAPRSTRSPQKYPTNEYERASRAPTPRSGGPHFCATIGNVSSVYEISATRCWQGRDPRPGLAGPDRGCSRSRDRRVITKRARLTKFHVTDEHHDRQRPAHQRAERSRNREHAAQRRRRRGQHRALDRRPSGGDQVGLRQARRGARTRTASIRGDPDQTAACRSCCASRPARRGADLGRDIADSLQTMGAAQDAAADPPSRLARRIQEEFAGSRRPSTNESRRRQLIDPRTDQNLLGQARSAGAISRPVDSGGHTATLHTPRT